MGVHISFVRSTNLDSWTLNQLRTMKVGGNASAADFFNRHGGSNLLNGVDGKTKYTSEIAKRYLVELDKRKKEDERLYPDGIHLVGVDLQTPVPAKGNGSRSGSGTSTPTNSLGASGSAGGAGASAGGEDDFFSTWDKPAPASARAGSPASSGTALPGIGLTRPVSTGPRTVTSSALRSGSGSASSAGGAKRPTGASRLSSSNTSATTSAFGGVGAPKASRLGAKKAAPINFEEVQRKALEEEERIKRLGYDRKREEEETKERERKEAEARKNAATAAAAERGSSRSSTPLGTSSRTTASAAPSKGPVRMGFGATVGAAASSSSNTGSGAGSSRATATVADDAPHYARDKFSAQKGISSDQYFGRGSFDPQANAEAQNRLQQFSGASAISSNAYFGRPEEEEEQGAFAEEGGLLGELGQNETVIQLERGMRDLAGRVMANPEVQNFGESIRTGALKVGFHIPSIFSFGPNSLCTC